MLKTRPRQSASHWQRTRRLTLGLLLIWLLLTFSIIFFARELSHISLFSWPLSFYMAAQGLALIYLLIVAVYTWKMKKLDQRQPDREQQ